MQLAVSRPARSVSGADSTTQATLLTCTISSRLGPIVLAARGQRLCGLWFDGQKHQPDARGWQRDAQHPVLARTAEQLQRYFGSASGQRSSPARFDVALDLSSGTAFQQAVWQALLDIPVGSTVSYSDLAQRIGRPQSVRAVAAAVGRNPISIIVPCHRVVGRDGSLTGYAGGIERKAALLAHEGAR
ncbi:MAG: methylated-DNA--[protein]-cysteine S-methyltransferase [Burkholderiaceae bacterium]